MDFDFAKTPEMVVVRQKLHRAAIADICRTVAQAMEAPAGFWKLARPGQTVAVAAGSRGIDRIDQVVCTAVEFFRKNGLRPFIVPAMGSHGGATPQGQEKILEKLGISEKAAGVPIRSEMETQVVGELPSGVKIHVAKAAWEADWIFPVNRVKPHTKFKLPVESGLCKILTVGLGKARGAAEFHVKAVGRGFGIIEEAAAEILKTGKVIGGLALVEDGAAKLCRVELLAPETMIEREKELLGHSYCLMARVPFDNIDILIVDRMGKDISGIGMDSNVTGRHRDIAGDFFTAPHVKRLFARDLSPGSDGNANGVGLADVVSSRLVRAMDFEKTKVNAVTAISPEKAAVPIHFETDLECLRVCALTAGVENPQSARIVRIRDTKNLEFIYASKAFADEIDARPELELAGDWGPFSFDGKQNLSDFPPCP